MPCDATPRASSAARSLLTLSSRELPAARELTPSLTRTAQIGFQDGCIAGGCETPRPGISTRFASSGLAGRLGVRQEWWVRGRWARRRRAAPHTVARAGAALRRLSATFAMCQLAAVLPMRPGAQPHRARGSRRAVLPLGTSSARAPSHGRASVPAATHEPQRRIARRATDG